MQKMTFFHLPSARKKQKTQRNSVFLNGPFQALPKSEGFVPGRSPGPKYRQQRCTAKVARQQVASERSGRLRLPTLRVCTPLLPAYPPSLKCSLRLRFFGTNSKIWVWEGPGRVKGGSKKLVFQNYLIWS